MNIVRARYRILLFASIVSAAVVGCDSRDSTISEGQIATSPASGASFVNSIGMRMVHVGPGRILMRSNDRKDSSASLEGSEAHRAQPNKYSLFMSETETTMKQYAVFLQAMLESDNPALSDEQRAAWNSKDLPWNSNPDHPASLVSWRQAVRFCEWLSKREKSHYRLPTIEEWEYACRAGTRHDYGCTSDEQDLPNYAWYSGNSDNHPHPVRLKRANAFGLFDMNGNVWEWTRSKVSALARHGTAYENQQCAFIKGGAFFNGHDALLYSARWAFMPLDYRSVEIGFRVVCEVAIQNEKIEGED